MSDAFLDERPRLWGLAYRILGSRADADDVVQEAWLRWDRTDQDDIERPAAWLTTVTSRLALDRLRARRREVVTYLGPWLPEPLITEPTDVPSDLADSITVGFLALLEKLDPTERVVFLLADVFHEPFADIATVVGRSEAASRQIASRARRRLRDARRPVRGPVSRAEQERLVSAFAMASLSGDLDALKALLAPDVTLLSDGGPNRHAARRPVVGPDRVGRLFINLAPRMPAGLDVRAATINGEPGLVLSERERPIMTMTFHITDAGIEEIYIVLNPDKLHDLSP